MRIKSGHIAQSKPVADQNLSGIALQTTTDWASNNQGARVEDKN